jgi:hypothetical protein
MFFIIFQQTFWWRTLKKEEQKSLQEIFHPSIAKLPLLRLLAIPPQRFRSVVLPVDASQRIAHAQQVIAASLVILHGQIVFRHGSKCQERVNCT